MKTKQLNLSASLEDYLEAIFNLAEDDNPVRSTDIAELLHVAKPSVTGALRLLREKQLVNYKPYGCVTLTKNGKAAAEEVVKKHNILKAFFIDILGIDEKTAQNAACQAEHSLGQKVIKRLLLFIEFVNHNNSNGFDLAKQFELFYKNKK